MKNLFLILVLSVISFSCKDNKTSDKQENGNDFIADVMRSNLALLWWGWCTAWGIIGFIIGCIKLWNYYA